MKPKISIKTTNATFQADKIFEAYIFSYLFLFLFENKLYNNQENYFEIDKDLITKLYEKIADSLRDLLKSSYNEPSIKDLQKHSSRFEKLLFEGNKYKVNYRMSISGRLAYDIYCLMGFIEKAKSDNISLYIEFEG